MEIDNLTSLNKSKEEEIKKLNSSIVNRRRIEILGENYRYCSTVYKHLREENEKLKKKNKKYEDDENGFYKTIQHLEKEKEYLSNQNKQLLEEKEQTNLIYHQKLGKLEKEINYLKNEINKLQNLKATIEENLEQLKKI